MRAALATALAMVIAALAATALAGESYPVDWKGTWQSSEGYESALSGTLTAKVVRKEGDRWEAAFSAVPVKGLALKIPLQGERDGKLVNFKGEVSLGPRGKIAWTGILHPEQFTGTFELVGSKIKGTFRMTPAAKE